MNEGTTVKSKAEDIAIGDVFSRFSCGTVIDKTFDTITVKNTEGRSWNISKEIVESEFQFANHSHEEDTCCRTDLINLIKANPRVAMTIEFTKKPDPKAAANVLQDGIGALTERQWNSKVKRAMEGEHRVVRGIYPGSSDEHGRLRFIIIGEPTGNGLRLVDPRTINSVIVNNKTYSIK